MTRTTFFFLLLVLFAATAAAQVSLEELLPPGSDLRDEATRTRAVEGMRTIETERKEAALAFAAQQGLPLRQVLAGGRVMELMAVEDGQPIYFVTSNANAAISTGANLLRSAPFSLSGAGITIGLWDGGWARETHQEFGSRMTINPAGNESASYIDHATHVGGTLIAAGTVASARGMADAATVNSYDWNNDVSEMTSRGAAAPGVEGNIYLSNHSYGIISGWNYVNNGTRVWEWYGSGTSSTSIEDDFGRYNTYARDMDTLAFNAPYYLIFRSAGNERTDNPSEGESVALSPGGNTVVAYSAATHPAGDGTYRGGYESISYAELAKDVITVGSVSDAVTADVRDANKANVSVFSSWGPTDDGRIKPDIVANGEAVYSTLSGSNKAYGTYSGTSMATPNAAGSAALLIEQYGQLFPGQVMLSSTLKALLIHTADDRGNAGPDYQYGWGLIHVKAAADLLVDHHAFAEKKRITEGLITSTTTTISHDFVWDGVSQIRATLCWTDPAGTATRTSDLRTPRLSNNLDLKITGPDDVDQLPYIMPFVGTWTQASMNLPATTGKNNTDNVEQVFIAAPPLPGVYRAVVTFDGTLANNQQYYSLIITGSSADLPPPPPLTITAVSPISGISGVVTLDLTGAAFRADTTVKLTHSGQADIVATSVQLIGDKLRCQVNITAAAAGQWDVVASNPGGETFTLVSGFTVVGAIWSENFDSKVTGWASQATTGVNSWTLSTALSHTPANSFFAPGPSSKTTTNLTSPSIVIPESASDLQLKFWHNYNLQSAQDGGRLEFSINNGAWFDVEASGSGTVFASNGYNTTIRATGPPPNRSDFAGSRAWSGSSNGFIETIVNLTDTPKFAGTNLRIRWSLATNSGISSIGWNVDSIALIGGGNLSNQPPAITTEA
jgi:hypothetical protein